MRYITSDLHFRHKNILNFCAKTRPWSSLEEMEDSIIDEINSLENCEMLYHLGDLFFGNSKKLHEVLDRIRVKMVFVFGNHCYRDTRKTIRERGYSCGDYMETTHNRKKVCLFHYPQVEWNQSHRGSIQLHGHVHSRLPDILGKTIDVGYDAHGRILTLDEAVSIADSKPLYSPAHGE
jgi:calcineurin-like phosphoesterase family protein